MRVLITVNRLCRIFAAVGVCGAFSLCPIKITPPPLSTVCARGNKTENKEQCETQQAFTLYKCILCVGFTQRVKGRCFFNSFKETTRTEKMIPYDVSHVLQVSADVKKCSVKSNKDSLTNRNTDESQQH